MIQILRGEKPASFYTASGSLSVKNASREDTTTGGAACFGVAKFPPFSCVLTATTVVLRHTFWPTRYFSTRLQIF